MRTLLKLCSRYTHYSILLVLGFALSGCKIINTDDDNDEVFLFFVQYENSAFGDDFRAFYINGQGQVGKAEDSAIPNITLDGSYTQQELEDYYFANLYLLGTVPYSQLDAMSDRVASIMDSGLEKVSDSVCADAGTYRYGFYVYNTNTDEYEETLLYVTAGDGIYLNTDVGADFVTEYLMELAVIGDIAFEELGPCAGYWDFDA
ncbi:hypothetical protein [Pleionea litopenaei]|uniref:Uncharacterized protein n=1 Tax=Pleionea litopenaei TaxID=3070815 RepID=A0AA51X7W8_9GAMM|nr:hypothetical protein [Pleionea sp. HL-JVS1]WMS88762.1 hypothetical protein Q9312_07545 [Pleionea sp. HL-JVS1]